MGISYLFFAFYYVIRMFDHLEIVGLELKALVEVTLIGLMLISILHKMYAFDGYGILTELVSTCIKQAIPFLIMLTIWMTAFAFIFKALGMDFGLEGTYTDLPQIVGFLFQVFENSLGNIAA